MMIYNIGFEFYETINGFERGIFEILGSFKDR
jgi:hypothetical protein